MVINNTTLIPSVPYNPRGLIVEERSTTSAKISWDQQTLVDHFEISFELATGGICPSYYHTHSGLTVDGGDTEFSVSGLEEYSTYSITVRAVNSAGISGPTTVRVTTLATGKAGRHKGIHLEMKAATDIW